MTPGNEKAYFTKKLFFPGELRRNCALPLTKPNCFQQSPRFAIVDESAPVRFLSREEFESLKELNPRLIEMRAGDLRYLTEPPMKS
jgi:hypothetical protein